jgi:hypothetical protein
MLMGINGGERGMVMVMVGGENGGGRGMVMVVMGVRVTVVGMVGL